MVGPIWVPQVGPRHDTEISPTRCPQKVENGLLRHPFVEEAAVVDAHGLTVPHAFIVPIEPRPGLDRELQAFVKERLETYERPRAIVLLDTLPRTHLGKVDWAQLRGTPR